MKSQCYMCERYSTSQEHVPPKCLFPEKKDLPEGINLRNNLLKVPSCDIHNTAKSHDDEYLLYCLCMNISNNSVAFRQFSTKVMRAYKRRPRLMKALVKDGQDVIAVNTKGVAFNTLLAPTDTVRINKCFDQIARALYFYEFQKKFIGHCRVLHDWIVIRDSKFKVFVMDGDKEISILDHLKTHFSKLDHKGSDPEIFKYHFEKPDDQGLVALSMQFYGGSTIFIAFMPSVK